MRRGKDGKESAADRRTPHVPVFLAVVGDIVFATVAGTFHRLARQQVEILPDERGDARILEQAAHQRIQQQAHGSRSLAGALYQRGGEHFHAVERRVHGAQVEDQRSIHAGVFHIDADNRELSPASVDRVEPLLPALVRTVTRAAECSHSMNFSVAKTRA